jgi:hypothetical protein
MPGMRASRVVTPAMRASPELTPAMHTNPAMPGMPANPAMRGMHANPTNSRREAGWLMGNSLKSANTSNPASLVKYGLNRFRQGQR